MLILTGLFGSYLLIPFLNAYPPDAGTCIAVPFIGHLSFALVFGSLLAKTYRLAKVFDTSTLRAINIRDTHLYVFLFLLLM